MSLTEHLEQRRVRAFSSRRRIDVPRRLAFLLASAFAIAPAVLHASADTAGTGTDPLTPRLGCTHAINDAPGDAHPDFTGLGNSPLPSNDGLDLQMADVRLTDTQLQVFMAIKRIPAPTAMAANEETYRYTMSFGYGGKGFTYGIEQTNPTWPAAALPTDSKNYPMMRMGVDAATDLRSSSTAVIRQGTAPDPSWIIFTSPRDKIEQILGAPIPDGASFINVAVTTQIFMSPEMHSTNDGIDSTVTGTQDSFVVGGAIGDWCFGPPPTFIQSVSVAPAAFTDSSTMSATLLDENGKALAGKPLTFAVDDGTGKTVTATTDANGRATAAYGPIKVRAGTYPVTVTFPGEAALRTATATGTLTVSPEACVFKALKVAKPSAKTRLVTATLVDNDGHPVAGVPFTWWVNGKKVANAKTASNGTAVLKSAKPGQTVQAKFAGVSGMYLAANSKATKV
jgi:hypothetical protein